MKMVSLLRESNDKQYLRHTQDAIRRRFCRRFSISTSFSTQECIDFCAKNNIVVSHELVKADQLDDIYKCLTAKNDSVKRYVLDCQNSAH